METVKKLVETALKQARAVEDAFLLRHTLKRDCNGNGAHADYDSQIRSLDLAKITEE
jgi:hypothetical protein